MKQKEKEMMVDGDDFFIYIFLCFATYDTNMMTY